MARKAAALRAAKERKQKKIAIVGAVLLLGLLAFQAPRMLKLLNKSDATAAPPPAATTPAPAVLPAPAIPGAPPAAPPPAPGRFAAVDQAPIPGTGQFASFERFETKDPFAQQVIATRPAAAPPAAKPDPGGAKPRVFDPRKAIAPKPTAPKAGTSPPGTTPTEPPAAPAANPTSAVISVNGVPETVVPGADFPAADKIFTLVSLAPNSAKIGIAGGSLTGGDETVALVKGKKLTLMNTADGTRYELVLVSLA